MEFPESSAENPGTRVEYCNSYSKTSRYLYSALKYVFECRIVEDILSFVEGICSTTVGKHLEIHSNWKSKVDYDYILLVATALGSFHIH